MSASILIAEDESITAEDLGQSLLEMGYSVSGVVSSGEDAVAKAFDTRPDLLLMDVSLAGELDGIQAVQRIREKFGVSVVYLTAHSDAATLRSMRLTEPYTCILKPFHTTELRSVIESALRTSQAANTMDRSRDLEGQKALVTGASSGIGRAIAIELGQRGAQVCLVGRNQENLDEATAQVRKASPATRNFRADLSIDSEIDKLTAFVVDEFGRLDILVHSAGILSHGRMESASVNDFDDQYVANVRAPWLLTQKVLPLLKASRGEVVFINSSTGLSAKQPGLTQFAATQHAVKAIAESLREEVNGEGIRVLTVHPGRTATPRQAALYSKSGRAYHPELLMQPEDVAASVLAAIMLPRTAELTEMSLRPMLKSY